MVQENQKMNLKSESGAVFSVFSPEVLARLGSFRLRAKHLAAGMSFGEHRSLRMGISSDFQDHRPWESGNDPKFIDWRVFLRTGKLFQRSFREETNTAFYFLVDFSGSMNYGGKEIVGDGESEERISHYFAGAEKDSAASISREKRLTKLEYAQCIAAVMARLALEQRDLVGLTATNGFQTVSLRPSTGEGHWKEILDFLEAPPFSRWDDFACSEKKKKSEVGFTKPQNFSAALNELAASCPKRGKIFLMSDFFDVETWESILPQLKVLRAQKNELIFFHILDRDEIEFPFESLHQFTSLENTGHCLTVSPATIREEYLKNFHQWLNSIKEGCRTLGIGWRLADTRVPIHQTILSGIDS